jgi:hypothetical protein
MRTGTKRRRQTAGVDGGEVRGMRLGPDVRDDEEDTLIQTPEQFEDYDELNGDGDATPDDRRRDPLRKSW